MDPFTAALMGGSFLSSLFGGYSQAKQEAAQAQQARLNAQLSMTRGTEIAEQSAYNLRQTLGNISALQNQRGVDLSSPTAEAVGLEAQDNSDRNEAIQRLGALQQAAAYSSQASGYSMASDFAIPMSALSGGLQAASIFQRNRAPGY